MATLAELRNQKEDIEKQIKEARNSERADALKTVKRLCKDFGFTATTLKGSLAPERVKKSTKSS